MSALKTFLANKHGFVAEGLAWTLPAEAVIESKKAVAGSNLKNVALFLAAPFVGLAYLMIFPLVGMGMIAWLLVKKLLANKTARPVVLAIAAPFAAIAFVTVGPVLGLGALAWAGGRALLKS